MKKKYHRAGKAAYDVLGDGAPDGVTSAMLAQAIADCLESGDCDGDQEHVDGDDGLSSDLAPLTA